jgi:hypothetical protein
MRRQCHTERGLTRSLQTPNRFALRLLRSVKPTTTGEQIADGAARLR